MSSNLSSNFLQFNFGMESASKHSIYRFDRFHLDCGKLMLYRDGEAVTLPPKVVKTLVVLVDNRGSILSKDELMERVWEDSIVEEANLSQNLYLLRKTLGNRDDGSPYIETLRRRGYKFTSDDIFVETAAPVPVEEDAVVHPTPAPLRYAVERRGNVVALVDWKEAEAGPQGEEAAAPQIVHGVEPRSSSTMRFLAGVVAVLVIAALGVGFWMNSPKAAEVEQERGAIEVLALTNGEEVNDATISRDGKYFTYHESDGEFSRLLVQQAGQSKAIEVLPRAKRVIASKTFSPDSQYIYYLAAESGADHNSIYRVPTLGGVQTKIVEYASSYVTFSPDGKSIAFVRPDRSNNASVVTAGSDGTGERTLITGSAERSITSNPAWSPDGSVIVFGQLEHIGSTKPYCQFQAVDVGTLQTRPLTAERWDTCHRIEWRRDGKGIVFVGTKLGEGSTIRRDQVYYVAIADGSSRRLTTDSSRNQEFSLGVTDSNQVLSVPFSRSSQLWVMGPNGDSRTAARLTNGSSDGRSGLVPLPNGRIAFTARMGESHAAWLVDGDGSNRQQIISDPPILEELRATPDGKYLFFSAIKDERSHLYRVDHDGNNLKQITAGDTFETDSSLAPDGKWIVFDSMPASNFDDRRLWRSSVEGGAPAKISDVKCAVPNYSPTGKYISCVWDNIFVVSAEDGNLVRTFPPLKIPMLNIGARWTPDEKALVYIVSQKGTTNLWLQPLDGQKPKRLTDFPNGDIYNFAYSHDGSKLYLARGFQIRDAVLISGMQ
ncbi:MAG TPA: winged helix-turn-helix domain-containing protein [Pyrinomonadaceae bacterium]|nr:winged helix-turn-helix domain-containing protein [Pyrinomonadaceae bacterium]